jgi:pimeloyl-ACP methyl ester carboxylesterase
LICFAGMAALYAAMPKFEFRKTLTERRDRFNFVWVRDVHRASYNLAPDGAPNGFDFFAKAIADALAALGSAHNVAIGASGGGAAAFAFSGVLPIHHVITFNPAFPLDAYCRPEIKRGAFLDWKKLFTSPLDYVEVVLIVLSAQYLWRRNCRLAGADKMTDVPACYLRKQPPVRATVFYSDHCLPDADQIRHLADIPEVSLKPIDSGRHNCMGELKKRGELGALIHAEILVGLAARHPENASAQRPGQTGSIDKPA